MLARATGQGETKPGEPNKIKNGNTEDHSPPGLQGRGGSPSGDRGEKPKGPEGRLPGRNKSTPPAFPTPPPPSSSECTQNPTHKPTKLTKLGNWNLGAFQTLKRHPSTHYLDRASWSPSDSNPTESIQIERADGGTEEIWNRFSVRTPDRQTPGELFTRNHQES